MYEYIKKIYFHFDDEERSHEVPPHYKLYRTHKNLFLLNGKIALIIIFSSLVCIYTFAHIKFMKVNEQLHYMLYEHYDAL